MDSYLGEILFFTGKYIPVNYLACAGQILNVADYEALFAAIGTTYGGNGSTTFGLPDLRARIPVSMGTGPSYTYSIGASFGVDTVTLTTANLPAHSHPVQADSSAQIGVADPTNGLLTSAVEAGSAAASCYIAATTNLVQLAPQTLNSSGGVTSPAPLDNRMPTMTLTPIICVVGLYPQRT